MLETAKPRHGLPSFCAAFCAQVPNLFDPPFAVIHASATHRALLIQVIAPVSGHH